VHALGIESHLGLDAGTFNAEKFKRFLGDVASLGLKIMITELDATDQNLPADISTRDSIVAGRYEEFLSVVIEEPSVIAVLTWGLSDKYTWLADERPRADKAPVRPLPLDVNFQRKLAWSALAQAFDKVTKQGPAPPQNLRVL
jgi:endo-1,4-beta-xylanase